MRCSQAVFFQGKMGDIDNKKTVKKIKDYENVYKVGLGL